MKNCGMREYDAKLAVLAQLHKHASLELLNETLGLALQNRLRFMRHRQERLADQITRAVRALGLLEENNAEAIERMKAQIDSYVVERGSHGN